VSKRKVFLSHELQRRSLTGYHITLTGVFKAYSYVKPIKYFYPSTAQRYQYTSHILQTTSFQSQAVRAIISLTPNVNYSGRTAPLTSKVAFYIFIQQI